MNFTWFFALLLAVVSMVSGQNCPANFKMDENKLCTANRPIHGECPAGSMYSANINKCVYVARG